MDRRLLAAGGWLALLRATLHIDLRQAACLETAVKLAGQAEHREF